MRSTKFFLRNHFHTALEVGSLRSTCVKIWFLLKFSWSWMSCCNFTWLCFLCPTILFSFFKIYYLVEKQSVIGRRDMEIFHLGKTLGIFHLPFLFPNDHNAWACKSRSFVWIFHVGGRAPLTWAIPLQLSQVNQQQPESEEEYSDKVGSWDDRPKHWPPNIFLRRHMSNWITVHLYCLTLP